ncbi:MAG TPA: GNAT family N-acetyltransferase [Acetobacteraceae bacterium]|nr:GNAT family N-acetyltransferase [Acetobacteraceae bacterium]
MGAVIRRAHPVDATVVALLGRITFAETFGHLFVHHAGDLRAYLDATFDVAKIERSLGKPPNQYWLAFQRGLPIGYAKLKHPVAPPHAPQQDAAQLQKIYVLREFLAQGIGHEPLAPAMHAASASTALRWLDVLRENDRAVGFYARHGFIPVGEDTYAIGTQRFLFHIMERHLP